MIINESVYMEDGSCSYECIAHLCFIYFDIWYSNKAVCFIVSAEDREKQLADPFPFVSIVTLICAPRCQQMHHCCMRLFSFCHLYSELCHKCGIIEVVNLNQSSLCLLSLQVCDLKCWIFLGFSNLVKLGTLLGRHSVISSWSSSVLQ